MKKESFFLGRFFHRLVQHHVLLIHHYKLVILPTWVKNELQHSGVLSDSDVVTVSSL